MSVFVLVCLSAYANPSPYLSCILNHTCTRWLQLLNDVWILGGPPNICPGGITLLSVSLMADHDYLNCCWKCTKCWCTEKKKKKNIFSHIVSHLYFLPPTTFIGVSGTIEKVFLIPQPPTPTHQKGLNPNSWMNWLHHNVAAFVLIKDSRWSPTWLPFWIHTNVCWFSPRSPGKNAG